MPLHLVKSGDGYDIVTRALEPSGYSSSPMVDTLVLHLTAEDLEQFRADMEPPKPVTPVPIEPKSVPLSESTAEPQATSSVPPPQSEPVPLAAPPKDQDPPPVDTAKAITKKAK